MPVIPADLILPVGKMPADWHQTSDIEEWIDAGYTSAPVEANTEQADAIATAHAYYRGYLAKAETLLGSPDSVGLGDMNVSQSNGRYDRMIAKAEEYRLEWMAAIDTVLNPTPAVTLRVSKSVTAPINYVWG